MVLLPAQGPPITLMMKLFFIFHLFSFSIISVTISNFSFVSKDQRARVVGQIIKKMEVVNVALVDPMSFHVRLDYAIEGKLFDLLRMTPKSKWTEKDDRSFTFLHHTLLSHYANINALILLEKSCPSYFKTFTLNNYLGPLSPFEFCLCKGMVKFAEVLCSMGYNCNGNAFNYISSYSDMKISRFVISNGWRINDSRYAQSLVAFQKGVVKCRDLIVILLGLKKQKRILPRLDRFLIQQELAVAIWSTRF